MTTDAKVSRRIFLGVAGAAAASPLLAGCGQGGGGKSGSTSKSQLSKIQPAFVPEDISGLKPDFPSVHGSSAGYLSYPKDLVRTVHETPGRGGTYTTIAPFWGSIPRTSGNTYYEALNAALGATMKWGWTNGEDISTTLPPLFAGNKLPDWVQVPTWAEPPAFGQAAESKLADLTPYLAGDKIKKYPNLAAIYKEGWQQGIWNGKIVGVPTVVTLFSTGVILYYRADILKKLGIGTPTVKSIDDLYDLGKEINDPKAKRWAFDDIFRYLTYPFDVGGMPGWTTDDKGDLITTLETDKIIEAMNWCRKIFKAGMVHPDSVAGNTDTYKQRFWSGQMLITSDGGGSWNAGDVVSGTAANKNYARGAFDFFSANGKDTPRATLAPPTEYVSYFNKRLKPKQIEELLRIADYLAAPYGSYEYTLVNYGKQNVDYTTGKDGPVLTATGNKDLATPALLASPNSVTSNPGYPHITREVSQWSQRNAKYGYKPLFYAMNITVPNDLTNANSFTPFSQTSNIMYEVVRGRKTISDYKSTRDQWLRNGGDRLKKFYESVRAKYGTN